MNDEAITTAQAALQLGVHIVTLRKWRASAELTVINGAAVLEDCQGLTFFYENPRRIMYYASSVQKLKRILNRRNKKQCQQQ